MPTPDDTGPPEEQGVETTPPATEVGETPELETQEAPEAPETPDVSPIPARTPQRRQVDPQRELSWLRTEYQKAVAELQKTRKDLQEYEYAALDEGERGQRELEERARELQEQQYALQEAAYAQGLWEFYTGYVPVDAIRGETPTEWQASVLDYLADAVQKLFKENQALKKAAVPGRGAPRVPAQKGGRPPKRSVFAMDWDEIERIREAAESGLLGPDDLPGA